jgi:hypothetical protein
MEETASWLPQIVVSPPGYGYNRISVQALSGGDVCLTMGAWSERITRWMVS